MRISILDPGGTLLAVALALRDLGHRVEYVPAEPWPERIESEPERLLSQLVAAQLGGPAHKADPGADLLVVADGFADWLTALLLHRQIEFPVDLAHPFRATVNPLVYPARLKAWIRLIEQARRVAVVDMSDCTAPRESGFEDLPHVTLLAREVPLTAVGGPWRPFPYLYHPLLLWLERTQPRASWFVPAAQRRVVWDWAFCGMVEHARYGTRRRDLITRVRAAWPGARSFVMPEGRPFVDVVGALQSAAAGLDLPGAGELCFRLHELLALGVPVLRPWPWSIATAPGLSDACCHAPGMAPDSERVVETYLAHYAPAAAARALLAAVEATPPGVASAPASRRR